VTSAKDIIVQPISSKDANALVKRVHYSGKVVNNSQLHFGVFLGKRLEGVMSFGCSMDKRKTQALVSGTGWNGFLELNRMAFSDNLPRNSESRAISIAIRLIRKHYPHIDWIISFADGTQCGDGTIYRASGFVLTQINKNKTIVELASGEKIAKLSATSKNFALQNGGKSALPKGKVTIVSKHGTANYDFTGCKPLAGYQFRYVYFIKPEAKKRLTCPIIPFSKIDEIGAGMYKGKARVKQANSEHPSECGGAAPTHTLQDSSAL
jgi:hypothetical protein